MRESNTFLGSSDKSIKVSTYTSSYTFLLITSYDGLSSAVFSVQFIFRFHIRHALYKLCECDRVIHSSETITHRKYELKIRHKEKRPGLRSSMRNLY